MPTTVKRGRRAATGSGYLFPYVAPRRMNGLVTGVDADP
jgi:hypothetical protein